MRNGRLMGQISKQDERYSLPPPNRHRSYEYGDKISCWLDLENEKYQICKSIFKNSEKILLNRDGNGMYLKCTSDNKTHIIFYKRIQQENLPSPMGVFIDDITY